MILILFIFSTSIALFSYYYFKKQLLSPTIISSGVFSLFSLIYLIFYKKIQYYLTFNTVIIITFSLLFTFIGEYLGRTLVFFNKSNKIYSIKDNYDNKVRKYIETSKNRTYFIFFVMILVGVYRFYDLYKFSLTLGNNAGILGTISSTRLAYALGEYNGGNILIALLTTASEIICYTYIYFFMYNFLVNKKIVYRNLLPIMGYCLIVVSFTGRTEYLKIGFSFLIVYLYLVYTNQTNYRLKKKVINKLINICLIIAIVFFAYGNITRDEEVSGINEIIAYSSAGIIGFDQYLNNPWKENPYLGYYTLQDAYSFIGIKHNSAPQHHLPFFYFGNGKLSSNIYTSLLFPIQDYGIMGFYISRVLLSFITIKLFNKLLKSKQNTRMIILLICSFMLAYCYISTPIADRFKDFILSPSTLIKYTFYSYFIIKIICKYSIKYIE